MERGRGETQRDETTSWVTLQLSESTREQKPSPVPYWLLYILPLDHEITLFTRLRKVWGLVVIQSPHLRPDAISLPTLPSSLEVGYWLQRMAKRYAKVPPWCAGPSFPALSCSPCRLGGDSHHCTAWYIHTWFMITWYICSRPTRRRYQT